MRDERWHRRYAVLAAAVGLTSIGGYAGYLLYPRFDLPAAQGAGLAALAAAAGTASFFSPCSFPLLLTLLGREAADTDRHHHLSRWRFAASLAVGATAFLILFGAVTGLGGAAVLGRVTFDSLPGIAIRLLVGMVLVGLGLLQLEVLPGSMHLVARRVEPLLRRQAELRRRRPVLGHALFGFGYVLAGFG